MSKKKKRKIIQFPQTPEAQIRTRARNLKIRKCYISEDWENIRECNILITREHINGNLTFGVFLTDLALFGVKDVLYAFNMSKDKFSDFIKEIKSNEHLEEIDYNLAHNIIYGSVDYANEYGFKPAKNYLTGKYILEEDNDDIPLIDVEFGEGGLPTIFCSDDEPRTKEIYQLSKIAGEGNYQLIYIDDYNNDNPYENREENSSEDNKWFIEEFPKNDFSETQAIKKSELWKSLYSLCDIFFSLKPWKYLYETDIFAVEIPDTNKLYFISIMGSEGSVFAMSAYEGKRALHQFWDFYEHVEHIPPESILTIPHMMISLGNILDINKEQKDIIKQLGLRKKGDKYFSNITRAIPGLIPSTPDEEHLIDLYHIITQCLNVAARAKIDENLIFQEEDNVLKYLFRVADKKENSWLWNDEYRLIEPTLMLNETLYMPENLKAFSSLDIGSLCAQIDVLMLPTPICEKNNPEYFPFMLVLLNPDTDIITEFETLTPFPNYDNMISKVPNVIMEKYIKLGSRPMKFEYKNHNLFGIMQFFEEKTPIQVVQSSELFGLDNAIESLLESLLKQKK